MKLAVREPESDALRRHLRRRRPLVSSALARTEVLRSLLGGGTPALASGRRVLARIDLIRLNDRVLNSCGDPRSCGASILGCHSPGRSRTARGRSQRDRHLRRAPGGGGKIHGVQGFSAKLNRPGRDPPHFAEDRRVITVTDSKAPDSCQTGELRTTAQLSLVWHTNRFGRYYDPLGHVQPLWTGQSRTQIKLSRVSP